MTLEQSREQLIEQIRTAFRDRKKGHFLKHFLAELEFAHKRPIHSYGPEKAVAEFEKRLRGKSWEAAVEWDELILYFTDTDYVYALSKEAFCYYLPAMLVKIVQNPEKLEFAFSLTQYMSDVLENFSVEQVNVLVAFLEFYEDFVQSQSEKYHKSLNFTLNETDKLRSKILAYIDSGAYKRKKGERRKAK